MGVVPGHISSFFNIGGVLTRTAANWWENLLSYTLLAAVVYSPLIVLTAFYLQRPLDDDALLLYQLILWVGGGLLGLVVTAVITVYVFGELRGHPEAFRRCIGAGLARLPAVLAVATLATLAMLAGLVLLVIPGLIILCMYWLAVPVATIERRGILASLKRSRILTLKLRGSIFGILVVIWVIEQSIAFLLGTALAGLPIGATLVSALVLSILSGTVRAVAAAVSYHDIRVYREGLDIRDLVAVFD